MYAHCSFTWLINTAGTAPRLNPPEKNKNKKKKITAPL